MTAPLVRQFDYDIGPALRKIKELESATDFDKIVASVSIEIDGLEELEEVGNLLNDFEGGFSLDVDLSIDGINSVQRQLQALPDPAIDIDVSTVDVTAAESQIAGLDQIAEVEVEVADADVGAAESVIAALTQIAEVTVSVADAEIASADAQIAALERTVEVPVNVDPDGSIAETATEVSQLSGLFSSIPFSRAVVGVGSITAALTGAVSAITSFESGLLEVATLLPQLDAAAVQALGEDVKSFAAEAGVTTDEVLPALYQAISAGVPPDNVFDFLDQANKAAVAGVSDLETAVDGLTSVTNAYGSDVLSTAEASDALFTAVRLGKTDFNQLSSSIFDVAPIASSLGVKFNDVAASLAQITSLGTPTRVATTQMKAALAELQDSGSAVNESFSEIAGETFPEFIAGGGDLRGALGVLEQAAAEAGVGANELFGSVEAGQAVLALTGKNAEAFGGVLDEFSDTSGATQQAFETLDASLGRTFDRIRAQAQVAFLSAAQAIEPFLSAALNFALDAIPVVLAAASDLGDDLGPIFDNVFVLFAGFGAVVDLIEGAGIPDSLSRIRDAFLGFINGVDIAPLLETLDRFLDKIREALIEVDYEQIFDNIAEGFELVFEVAEPVFEFLIDLLIPTIDVLGDVVADVVRVVSALLEGDWVGAWNAARSIVATVQTAIQSGINQISTTIRNVDWAAVLDQVWTAIQDGAAAVWPILQEQAVSGINAITSTISNIDWEALLDRVWAGIQAQAPTVWAAVSAQVVSGINAVTSLLSNVDWAAVLEAVWTAMQAGASAWWTAAVELPAAAITEIGSLLANVDWVVVLQAVWDTLQASGDIAWAAIEAATVAAINGIGAIISNIDWGDVLQTVWDGVQASTDIAWATITAVITTAIDALPGVISASLGALEAAGLSIGEAILDGLEAAFGVAGDIGTGLINGIIAAINSGIGYINSQLGSITIPNPVPGQPDIVIPLPQIPSIIPLAEGAFFPATPGGQLLLAAENGHGELYLNEGASFARNIGLLSQFQQGDFLRQIAGAARSSSGASSTTVTDQRSYTFKLEKPPTRSETVWAREMFAQMNRHIARQDSERKDRLVAA